MRTASEIASDFAPTEHLSCYRSFFLAGIGGAGMSALARMLKHRGYEVRGTDSTRSETTDNLIQEGIPVRIGHSGDGIGGKDALILSDAIDLGLSPEVSRAKQVGAPMFRRSQALGWLLSGHKLIAVTGTHGKTTTTGMIGAGLIEAGLDPTVVVGASVPAWGGHVVEGHGEWAVAEACEAYDSFHDLKPTIVVLTNLELDHVDFHGSYANLRDSVARFVRSADLLIYCEDDPGAKEIAGMVDIPVTAYSANLFGGKPALPGRHNLENAAGALRAAVMAGANEGKAREGITKFTGAERRLQVLREGEITVVDDYAHHPSEIEASVLALRERYPGRRLVVVYQPHLYSRTAGLIPEFSRSLDLADFVVLTDIYPAREEPMPGVSSARIAELLTKPLAYVPSRHLLPGEVHALAKPGDVIVGMGAGNIAEFVHGFIRLLDRHSQPGKKVRVAVLYGGDSAEREVSLLSGRAVHRALLMKGYEATLLDVSDRLLSTGDLTPFIGPDRPDVAFLAVHGTGAEDGAIQGLLELLHMPYTGSSLQSSAICMDKQLTKQILVPSGLRVPHGAVLHAKYEKVDLPLPLIVKPNAQGSTVGLAFVESAKDLRPAIERAFAYDQAVLVEEWIKGMEVSVPVLGDRVLPVVEIAPTSGKYDFESKYTPGATEEIVPARLSEEVTKSVQGAALRAHRALNCAGATRTDLIIRDGEPFVLEVNTLPGLTGTSLLPNSARAAGISFEDLVDWIVQDALKRHAEKTKT